MLFSKCIHVNNNNHQLVRLLIHNARQLERAFHIITTYHNVNTKWSHFNACAFEFAWTLIIVQYKLIFEQLELITQVLIQSMRCKNHVMVPDMQFVTQYMNQICKGIIGRKKICV